MRKLLIGGMGLLVALLLMGCLSSPRTDFTNTAFVTRWRTDHTNGEWAIEESSPNQIRLSLSDDGVYDFVVDWGDGSDPDRIIRYDLSELTHTYESPGEYTVMIDGQCDGFGFFPRVIDDDVDFPPLAVGDSAKLLDVEQWGEVKLHNQGFQFLACTNLEGFSAVDTPILNHITDMLSMFFRAQAFNGDIGGWDVSNVTDMNGMFFSAEAFNQDIGSWDVSNVTDMAVMFGEAATFNQDIGDWDVSNVTTMAGMFQEATAFNQDIGDWDVSKVTTMNSMFFSAEAFNQDIGGWDVSNVTDMSEMFDSAISFNQDIGGWDVDQVTSYDEIFTGAMEENHKPPKFR